MKNKGYLVFELRLVEIALIFCLCSFFVCELFILYHEETTENKNTCKVTIPIKETMLQEL